MSGEKVDLDAVRRALEEKGVVAPKAERQRTVVIVLLGVIAGVLLLGTLVWAVA
ncbi:hypothetical protein [Cellulosimicrobium funkei]|uniref:hypothetical protein n=1 Tax=Cellulosimicrobium funkei TaxID=264251 RepID=UPI000AF0F112|nr:hypothetical protein [Cellulosimicrobium funkei]